MRPVVPLRSRVLAVRDIPAGERRLQRDLDGGADKPDRDGSVGYADGCHRACPAEAQRILTAGRFHW